MHKFVYENDYEGQLSTKVEFTIPSDASLDDMLEEFQNYLKATGFVFDGNVDIVPAYEAVNSKKKLWDATPEEWNEAYKNVTVKFNGQKIE